MTFDPRLPQRTVLWNSATGLPISILTDYNVATFTKSDVTATVA